MGRSPAGHVALFGNYEHVIGDIAGTVTIPSPVGITLNLDTLITR